RPNPSFVTLRRNGRLAFRSIRSPATGEPMCARRLTCCGMWSTRTPSCPSRTWWRLRPRIIRSRLRPRSRFSRSGIAGIAGIGANGGKTCEQTCCPEVFKYTGESTVGLRGRGLMRSITVLVRVIAIVGGVVVLTAETYDEARAFGFGFYFGGHRHRHHHYRGGRDAEDRDTNLDSKADKRRGKAMLARTGDALFKTIVVSKGLGSVGVEEEINPSKIDAYRDNKRDYTGALDDLLKMIDNTSKRSSREGASFLAQGDVTQHALDRAVSQAYEASNLAVFEQFVGEQWTGERLRVAIIDRARTEVPGLLKGNNMLRVEFAPV